MGVCLEQCYEQMCRSPVILFRGRPRRGAATCSRFQGPRILDIVPPQAEPRHFVAVLDIVPPKGGATLGRIDTICGTWNTDRGTRCSMPPKGAATLCHIDTRYSMLGYPQDIPRRGCDILSHTRCSMIICRIDTRSSSTRRVRQFVTLTF